MFEAKSKRRKLEREFYGIVKFSDLTNVFELFLFSEIFGINRDILKAGNSIMITLMKNYSDESKLKRLMLKKYFKRIN